MATSLLGVGNRKGPCLAGVAAGLLLSKAQDGLRLRHTVWWARASASLIRALARAGSRGFVRSLLIYRHLFYRLVLKHEPRSLTYMRLLLFKPNMSNESERCQSKDAASANCDPLENALAVSISVRTRKMVNYAWVG